MTTCATCNRRIWVVDADEDGNCTLCAAELAKAAPAEPDKEPDKD